MNKLALIALGIASAAATGFSSTWSPTVSTNVAPYLDATFGLNSDITYTTIFNAANGVESYGLEFHSFVDITL
jgi:hypothetical protein